MATSATAPTSTAFAESFEAVATNIEQVLKGKRDVIELVLVGMIAEGHLLIEDVPGVGKTSLAKALALSIDCSWGRVQFTPDLLPADVVGVTIWNRNAERFEFRRGPVFNNVLLADEINRASPKTQSALLEAMEERQVTVDGVTTALPVPFLVIATQNPVEHEGTYPLPDSQLDRFLLRLTIGYPGRAAEIEILNTHAADTRLGALRPVVRAADVVAMIEHARGVHVAPALKGYLVDLAEASRRHPSVQLGMSPRATLALMRASRARAAAVGRHYVIPDDVKALAAPVLAHRMLLAPEAELQGLDAADVVADLVARVPVPSGRT